MLIQITDSWSISTAAILEMEHKYNINCWDENNKIYKQIEHSYKKRIKSPEKL